ncbi:MAG: hypothetical protein GY839_00545 [candidate division Zixibacteria bacterium]|nr:hypothetical protein [candidate division Zixibacteria bacterium]
MKTAIPDYMQNFVDAFREAFCETLHDPALWSENIFKETLNRVGGQTFNITDVQVIIKDYLTVLSESIRRGEVL